MVAPIPIDSEELDEAITIAPDFLIHKCTKKAPFGVVALLGHKIHHYDTFMKDGKNIILYIVVSVRLIMLIRLHYFQKVLKFQKTGYYSHGYKN